MGNVAPRGTNLGPARGDRAGDPFTVLPDGGLSRSELDDVNRDCDCGGRGDQRFRDGESRTNPTISHKSRCIGPAGVVREAGGMVPGILLDLRAAGDRAQNVQSAPFGPRDNWLLMSLDFAAFLYRRGALRDGDLAGTHGCGRLPCDDARHLRAAIHTDRAPTCCPPGALSWCRWDSWSISWAWSETGCWIALPRSLATPWHTLDDGLRWCLAFYVASEPGACAESARCPATGMELARPRSGITDGNAAASIGEAFQAMKGQYPSDARIARFVSEASNWSNKRRHARITDRHRPNVRRWHHRTHSVVDC